MAQAMLDFMFRDGQFVAPRVFATFGRSVGAGTATQVYAALKAPEARRTPAPTFAYKALHNKDTLHIKH